MTWREWVLDRESLPVVARHRGAVALITVLAVGQAAVLFGGSWAFGARLVDGSSMWKLVAYLAGMLFEASVFAYLARAVLLMRWLRRRGRAGP